MRKTRIAISPRFATSTFENRATWRIFSIAVGLADQLTVARMLAVPVVIVLYVWDFPNHDYWATVVFGVAMATDWFDGRIARRSGQTSALGSLLDPIADKILVMSVLVVLVGEGAFPGWMVALIIAREFFVSGLRLAAMERGVTLEVRDLGKLKTWAQAIAAGSRRLRGRRCVGRPGRVVGPARRARADVGLRARLRPARARAAARPGRRLATRPTRSARRRLPRARARSRGAPPASARA